MNMINKKPNSGLGSGSKLRQSAARPPLANTRVEVTSDVISSAGLNIRELMSPERGFREVECQPGLHQDKLVSKSPAEKYHHSTENMALLFDSNELSLDQISFAKCKEQKPVYQFLENCVKLLHPASKFLTAFSGEEVERQFLELNFFSRKKSQKVGRRVHSCVQFAKTLTPRYYCPC